MRLWLLWSLAATGVLEVGQVQLMTVPVFLRVLRPVLPRSAHGSVTVVRLRGELDVLDARALRAFLAEIRWPERPRSILDLSELDFIDCACLNVLAWHARDVRAQGGTVELAGAHGAVRRMLAVTGLLTGPGVHWTAGQADSDRVRRAVIFPRPTECARLSDAPPGQPTGPRPLPGGVGKSASSRG